MAKDKLSPGMQQYLDIKSHYPDAFLLFRMGDFYELFYEDAVEAARLLEISLTSRNKNAENPIPMAGVPYHSAQSYIDQLVEAGYKVAIAEQMEDPKQAVGVVKREVVQVITPGTVVDSAKPVSDNNYLVSLGGKEGQWALAYMDLATGQFRATQFKEEKDLISEIRNLRSREVVLPPGMDEELLRLLKGQLQLLVSEVPDLELDSPLLSPTLTALEREVAARLLAYVKATQLRELAHLKPIETYGKQDFLRMDYASMTSLDLTENARSKKKAGSLYWLLDRTRTAMGGRLLRQWIQQPLVDQAKIEERLDQVEVLLASFFERADIQEELKGVYDIERLVSRVSFGKTTPRDLLQLVKTLKQVPGLRALIEGLEEPVFASLLAQLDPISELAGLIDAAIDEEAPLQITEGGMIKTGFDPQLDQYRLVMREGSSWILDLEAREKEASGISTLKIDYNKKDGYYFHITNSQLDKVPDHFFRKATLKNSERYGSEELGKIESQMLEAREESASLEYSIFMRIREEVAKYMGRLQGLAQGLASLDVLQALATVAETEHLIRPHFNQDRDLAIVDGRHAVVEKVMGSQSYVPNSIHMGPDQQTQLITGPNMSGKSTYMRQLAVLVIMAQMGSFVPAKEANLPIFDAIYTRIGAADDLVGGQSTFMVEMMEANQAIATASPDSLILFDELGRGTATYDGMALAQAIIEYIHEHTGAKTLFATHYHELTSLAETLSGLVNVHVATLEEKGQVTFLHKIEEGAADQSYGIHVAKIAGLPKTLLDRAQTILSSLEGQEGLSASLMQPRGAEQISLFEGPGPLEEALAKIDPNSMTPLEALQALDELKKML